MWLVIYPKTSRKWSLPTFLRQISKLRPSLRCLSYGIILPLRGKTAGIWRTCLDYSTQKGYFFLTINWLRNSLQMMIFPFSLKYYNEGFYAKIKWYTCPITNQARACLSSPVTNKTLDQSYCLIFMIGTVWWYECWQSWWYLSFTFCIIFLTKIFHRITYSNVFSTFLLTIMYY